MEVRKFAVLLVDDEQSILRALERVLRGPDRDILAASGGPEALEMLARQPFDLVISDQRMPGMNGTEFLSQVRQRYPVVYRVMLSGYGDFDSIVGAVNDAQVDRFIAKPWDNTHLRELVSDLLARSWANLASNLLPLILAPLRSFGSSTWNLARTSEGLEFSVEVFDMDPLALIETFRGLLPVLGERLTGGRHPFGQGTVRFLSQGKVVAQLRTGEALP